MDASVLKAPAGLGKTRAFAAQVAKGVGVNLSEVYVPTIKLAIEWRDHILAAAPHARVQVMFGRDHEVRPGTRMCVRHGAATRLSEAGLSVHTNLCKRSNGIANPPDECPHFRQCSYIQQFSPADVYIYTHAHLRLERGPLERWQPREVIIDESFVMSMYETLAIPLSLLLGPNIPAAAQALCRDVAQALANGAPLAQRLRAASGPRGELNAAIAALNLNPPLSPLQTDVQQRQLISGRPNFRTVQMLLRQLAAEAAVRSALQSVEIDTASGNIILHYRHPITRFGSTTTRSPTITILDASADVTILSRFFRVTRLEKLDARRMAHVVQCSSIRGSTTSFVPQRNKDPTSAQAAKRRLADVGRLVNRLVSDKSKVLVVGPSAITGNPAKGVKPLLKLPARVASHVEFAHFNAVRGIDKWKDGDAVVIIGRNEPPATAVEGIARALFHDDPSPLNLAGDWTTQMRGYRLTEGVAGVDTIVHADPRVQAVLEQIRESESVQAIDRLRLIHSTRSKLVFILSNVPLDITVDELRSWDELIDGTRIERAWDRCAGVLPLDPAWLAKTYPDLWPSAGAAKKDVQRAGDKKGHLPNGISIRNLSLLGVQFKQPTARRWSVCLATSDKAGRVQQELTRLYGTSVQVRNPR